MEPTQHRRRPGALFSPFVQFARRLRNRRAIRRLEDMDDYRLRDIGLDRHSIRETLDRSIR